MALKMKALQRKLEQKKRMFIRKKRASSALFLF
jgi:hypothetical protein